MDNVRVIRPGLMVHLSVGVEGGREYKTEDKREVAEGNTAHASWRSERTVYDIEEFQKAEKVRTECRAIILRTCKQTDLCLICPAGQENDLYAAIREARTMASNFNENAVHSRVRIKCMIGRIASDEAESARAVAAEMADLVSRMESGIMAGDVEGIRDAAERARKLGAMLDESQQGKVNEAIKAARAAATAITRRVRKLGEDAETVVNDVMGKSAAVTTARFAFMDMEEKIAEAQDAMPAVDVQRFAEVADDVAPIVEEAHAEREIEI